jgi:hypothetical protein
MMRFLVLCSVLVLAVVASPAPARAGDFWQPSEQCYGCVRDAIYDRFSLIARMEANPDVDEGVKGPAITAARAEIHRLRATIGPPPREWATPCCYARKPIHVR